MTPSAEQLALLVAVLSLTQFLSLLFIWRLIELAYQRELRIENLIPIGALKDFADAAVTASRTYTESTPTPKDDFLPPLLERLFGVGIQGIEDRKNNPEEILNTASEEVGVG